jgi:predicted nucleic acid-binding protein
MPGRHSKLGDLAGTRHGCMQHDKLTNLVSYDRDFDAILDITREEP